MQYLLQNSGTGAGSGVTISIGPALDSTGAEYTGLVIGDLTLVKNGTSAALAANATLTHTSNGHYDLVTIGNNADTLGRLRIRCNKSGYQVPPLEFMVMPAMIYNSIVAGSDRLDTNVTHVGDTSQTAGDIIGDTNDIQARLPAALGANGNIKSDVRDLLGTAWLAPGTAGTPDVNTKLVGGSTIKQDAGYVRVLGPEEIYIKHDGNNTTSGTSLRAAIAAVTTSQSLRIGAGTWTTGANQVIQPDGTIIRGVSRDVTWITNALTGTAQAQYKPGSNSLTEDLTWQSTITNSAAGDYPLGVAPSDSSGFTRAVARRLRLIGWTDALILSNTNACSIDSYDCILQSHYDLVATLGASHEVYLRNIEGFADEQTTEKIIRGVNNLGANIYGDNVRFVLRPRTATITCIGISSTSGHAYFRNSKVVLEGLAAGIGAENYSIAGALFDEENPTAIPALVMVNSEFDRSKIKDTRTVRDDYTPVSNTTYGLPVILADTNELQTDWVNGGRLDLLIDSAVAQSTAGAASAAAVKLKTDNLPSDPADASDIAAAFATAAAAIAAKPTAAQNAAALLAATLANGGTAGDALEAALAQGYGKWVIDTAAKTLKLYAPNGTTVLKTFALSPTANAAISRTPQ